ncbi:MAG: PfkB family carbohydrate kinase [Sphaerochaetaceae bacterium]
MVKERILVVCLNPTFQITLNFSSIKKGEVNRTKNYNHFASGKGVNVVRMIKQLNEEAVLLSHLGGERVEEFIRLALKDEVKIISADSKSPIRTCVTLNDDKTTELIQEPKRVDYETGNKILKKYKDSLENFSIVVFSGTRAPGYSKSFIPEMVKIAKEQGKKVILDVKGFDLFESLKYKPEFIKVNLTEFSDTFLGNSNLLEQDENLQIQNIAFQKMKEIYLNNKARCIITRGQYPTWYLDEDLNFQEKEVEKVKVVNTVGCGDAFTAGLAVGLLRKFSLDQCLSFAGECGSKKATCSKVGSFFE